MGCSGFSEAEQAKYPRYPVQYITYQNPYNPNQMQNVVYLNQNAYIQQQGPKLPEIDPNFLKDCDNIETITTSESEYKGQMKDGKRNGKGRMRWFIDPWKGDIYEGEWKNGYRYGKGTYKFNNGYNI